MSRCRIAYCLNGSRGQKSGTSGAGSLENNDRCSKDPAFRSAARLPDIFTEGSFLPESSLRSIFDADKTIIGWKRNIYSFPPVGAPESGAHVTAGDLDKFLRAVQQGKLLSPELTKAFLTPKVHYKERDGWTMQYGYGIWFYVDDAGEVVCYQKEGINAGVSNAMRFFPKQDINVVILTNMEEAVWEPIWKVHEVVVEAM